MNWLQGLRKTRARFADALRDALASPRPDETTIEELSDLLVTADVPLRLVQAITRELEQTATRREPVRDTFRRVLLNAIGPSPTLDWAALPAPTVILLVGINGSGKTTTAAKLAYQARLAGRKPLLGAADTWRAAGSRQLGIWAERIGCESVIGATGADAAAVAYDALDAAVARGCDLVLLDTAGRMHTREPLMRELQKVRAAMDKRLPGAPHHTWIVLDAMLGQNAVVQARQFHDLTPLTGVVATKLDGSSKGGFLFAVRQELDLPILFAGLGEGENDLAPFDPAGYVDALLATGEPA
ncbi:MAG TPA: signal recognition particle-docking protein FtsY [Kiritimatiellia bacterium]|jgi:fused signal recognition particle receptor|nr:signal recognition particle-docking protein FtsY [Kiritimatiellia bacterium]MDD4118092.1 signal recognition particle-docking protein FtsY [Kiritimatiellia bacterium]NCC92016.1 signal recognition particle-docking protein FtsY [Opitutae bacterium]HPC57483.1 signal recognition particle-docking protein FtsY [Kiritimatiellia bacterium]